MKIENFFPQVIIVCSHRNQTVISDDFSVKWDAQREIVWLWSKSCQPFVLSESLSHPPAITFHQKIIFPGFNVRIHYALRERGMKRKGGHKTLCTQTQTDREWRDGHQGGTNTCIEKKEKRMMMMMTMMMGETGMKELSFHFFRWILTWRNPHPIFPYPFHVESFSFFQGYLLVVVCVPT